jgi:hypothetical protein
MDVHRFDAATRRLATASRRTMFGLTLAGMGGLVASPEGWAKKRKRRKRKRKKAKATCAQSCPAPCKTCFHRPSGPPLCGNGANGSCNQPCLTDSDCVETGRPYCLTGHTQRLTNVFEAVDCPQGHRSICYDVTACG